MARSVQFDTKNQSFRQIMGNGLKYNVPRFQRDYSWEEEQWDDLWQDITKENKDHQHYMGYLVLQSTDNKNFIIIDGQQRLTTISIIVLSVLYELKDLINKDPNEENKKDNKKRLETLTNSFIGFTDPVSLAKKNKLSLNRNNDNYFKTYFCELVSPAEKKINQSEHLMRKSLSWFRKRIREHTKSHGEKMAQFTEDMADLLLFTTITVTEDTNAYSIFETLNARGVRLSTPDLIKNYIFSIIDKNRSLHDNDIRDLDDQWGNIIDQLGKNKFSDFIRADWNSRNELTSARELFQKIKIKINTNNEARDYLKTLQENSQIYSALKDESDEFWKNHQDGKYNDPKLKSNLRTLRLLNIASPLSALIAAFKKFDNKDFIRFFSFIEMISIRYNFIGNQPANEQYRVYSETARIITEKPDISSSGTLSVLGKIYPSDDSFFNSFSEKVLKIEQSDKKAKYLLYRIESHLNKDKFDFDALTLEHILPKKYGKNWEENFDETDRMDTFVNRIGNMTILNKNDNQSLGNKNFTEKKEVFAGSPFKITRKCAEYQVWNEKIISEHQNWLGEQAKSLWRISGI